MDRQDASNATGPAPVFLGCQHLAEGRGGIAVVARLTARVLLRMQHEVRLVSLLDTRDGEIGGARWSTTRGRRLAFAGRCHFNALACGKYVYDSVSTARDHPRLAPLDRPYAMWMHGIEVWYSLKRDRRRALRKASVVIVNSAFTLRRFEAIHGALPGARVCWLGTESDDLPPAPPSFQGPPTALMLGTLDRRSFYKGHAEVIESWPSVVAAVPEARLVIAGGGDGLDHVLRLVKESPASASIEVTGFVEPRNVEELWRRATVMVLPSRKEGFGLVYVEAMRQGIPVIASVHDAGSEVNVDGQTGFNVDLDKQGDLPARLIHVLGSTEVARVLGRTGRTRWEEHFRFSAFERRFQSILFPFLMSGAATEFGEAR